MKRVASLTLVIIMVLSLLIIPANAAASLNNFQKIYSYVNGQFTDVSSADWFAESVAGAYEFGLMKGDSATYFNANGNLTIAETVTLASRIHSTYYKNGYDFTQGDPWYQVYVDYALDNGIISYGYTDYDEYITRGEFAKILSKALPASELPAVNTIEDGAIPDVQNSGAGYYSSVYMLYRAGILRGNDSVGTFTPNNNIVRSEVATIVNRMVDKSQRVSLTLTVPKELTASQIFEKCSSSVFYIEIYDASGTAVASGSGFFITSDGVAVTNYHVIEDAASAVIMTSDGNTYEVLGAYDYDPDYDIALLQIDGSGFDYLDVGDSENLTTGADIFTIGSPLGLSNTISPGIISNAKRVVDGIPFIQITAPISKGSSGGALINTSGEVIGITSATFSDGQNLNLAVPIHLINTLSRGSVGDLPGAVEEENNTMISASATSVSVNVGESKTIYFSVDKDGVSLTRVLEDTNVASCKWGSWDGWTIPMTITGYEVGTTTMEVYANTHNSNTIIVTITVTGSGNYYSGTTVPDYAKVTGTALKDIYYADDGVVYSYNYNSQALINYREYLESKGWYLYTTDSDIDYFTYYYTDGSELIGISRQYSLGEVWIVMSY